MCGLCEPYGHDEHVAVVAVITSEKDLSAASSWQPCWCLRRWWLLGAPHAVCGGGVRWRCAVATARRTSCGRSTCSREESITMLVFVLGFGCARSPCV